MKALVDNDNVVEVAQEVFEVHNSLQWMDCADDCTTEWVLVAGILQPPVVVESKRTYDQLRKTAYDALNQLELISDDAINGTTTHADAILAIKAEFPKPV